MVALALIALLIALVVIVVKFGVDSRDGYDWHEPPMGSRPIPRM